MPVGPVVTAAVEGIVDEAVVRQLLVYVGAVPGAVLGKNGKSHLRQKIGGYNNAARLGPWLVLVDLNNDAQCAPRLCRQWLPNPAPQLCFRVAVRQVEAWLMGDAEAFARYLRVARSRIPNNPESLPNAKAEIVNIARGSRTLAVREDMVPRPGSGRAVGPAYASRLIEYTQRYWRPNIAAQRADSLRRTIDCLQRLVDAAR